MSLTNRPKIPEYFPYVLIAAVCLLLYLKTLFFGLTFFDDNIWVEHFHGNLKDTSVLFDVFTKTDISFPPL